MPPSGKSFARAMDTFMLTPLSVPGQTGRIDKWLWTARLFKTRQMATTACRAGEICISSRPVKAARDVQAGEIVTVRLGLVTRTLKVLAVPAGRVGAKLVPAVCEDLTPAAEYAKARAAPVSQFLARAKGAGRPTKRDRRKIERLLGEF